MLSNNHQKHLTTTNDNKAAYCRLYYCSQTIALQNDRIQIREYQHISIRNDDDDIFKNYC